MATNKLKLSIFLKFVFLFFLTIYVTRYTLHVYAGPQSTTYELKEFGFGSGGTENIDSTSYSLFGTAGEMDVASVESNTYRGLGGLIFTMQAFTPPAPTVSNTNQNYDRLLVTIQTGGNPTDAEYALSITDGTTTWYIQNDYTIGTVLGTEDWLLYSGGQTVGWGGGSGFYVTGLSQNTAYSIRVKARQGNYTETGWSVETTQSTSVPSLSFGVDASAISFSALNSGNSYTDASKLTTLTTSTNAYNGYIVYGRETQALTHTGNGALTIPDYAGTNTTPTVWSGTGFGYTSNDSNLTGGTADRFTNGGPKYAGFITTGPGDPVADHAGPIVSPVVNEQFNLSYRVTATSTTPAGEYKTTVVYTVVPTY